MRPCQYKLQHIATFSARNNSCQHPTGHRTCNRVRRQTGFLTFIMTQCHYVRTSAMCYQCGDNHTKVKTLVSMVSLVAHWPIFWPVFDLQICLWMANPIVTVCKNTDFVFYYGPSLNPKDRFTGYFLLDWSGICQVKGVVCAKWMKWSVPSEWSGLCQVNGVDCAKWMKWSVPSEWSGLCQVNGVACAKWMEHSVPCEWSGLWQGNEVACAKWMEWSVPSEWSGLFQVTGVACAKEMGWPVPSERAWPVPSEWSGLCQGNGMACTRWMEWPVASKWSPLPQILQNFLCPSIGHTVPWWCHTSTPLVGTACMSSKNSTELHENSQFS